MLTSLGNCSITSTFASSHSCFPYSSNTVHQPMRRANITFFDNFVTRQSLWLMVAWITRILYCWRLA